MVIGKDKTHGNLSMIVRRSLPFRSSGATEREERNEELHRDRGVTPSTLEHLLALYHLQVQTIPMRRMVIPCQLDGV